VPRARSNRGPVARPFLPAARSTARSPRPVVSTGKASNRSKILPSFGLRLCPPIITSHFAGTCSCGSLPTLWMLIAAGTPAAPCPRARWSLQSTGLDKAPRRAPITSLKKRRKAGNSEPRPLKAGYSSQLMRAAFATQTPPRIIFLACTHSPRHPSKQNDPTVVDRRVVEGERNGIEQEIKASQRTDGPTSQYAH